MKEIKLSDTIWVSYADRMEINGNVQNDKHAWTRHLSSVLKILLILIVK